MSIEVTGLEYFGGVNKGLTPFGFFLNFCGESLLNAEIPVDSRLILISFFKAALFVLLII